MKERVVYVIDDSYYTRAHDVIVDNLSFTSLKDNLHELRDFAESSLGFNKIHFSYSLFKLTAKNMNDTKANMDTLNILLKKTKGVFFH